MFPMARTLQRSSPMMGMTALQHTTFPLLLPLLLQVPPDGLPGPPPLRRSISVGEATATAARAIAAMENFILKNGRVSRKVLIKAGKLI